MSSLTVVHDSRLVLLEIIVENLYMPWKGIFDAALMKKTVIMFRMLDEEWTSLMPNRQDYRSYRGSNYENERFYGGRSVLFAVPEETFEKDVSGVDLQLYVSKEVSKYFELERRQNFGFTLVKMDDLLNGIIKDLRERKELGGYFSSALEREPISRSTRGTFPLFDEDVNKTDATIEVYVRISFLGKCIITEVYAPISTKKAFYAREETDPRYPYQFRELTTMDVESFCWGSLTIIPPVHPDYLTCACKTEPECLESATQTKKKKRKQKATLREMYMARLALVQELLAKMKEARRNRPQIMQHGEGPKAVCPTCICPEA
nr:PREDICTED: uncharacterized protein LOC100882299 isoform X3 [Megachile rotundata]